MIGRIAEMIGRIAEEMQVGKMERKRAGPQCLKAKVARLRVSAMGRKWTLARSAKAPNRVNLNGHTAELRAKRLAGLRLSLLHPDFVEHYIVIDTPDLQHVLSSGYVRESSLQRQGIVDHSRGPGLFLFGILGSARCS